MNQFLTFSFAALFFTMTSLPAEAANKCPTEVQWQALKRRAYFNKFFVAATTCKLSTLAKANNMDARHNAVRDKFTTTYRDFYEEQMEIASAYYDEVDLANGLRRPTRLSNNPNIEESKQNANWSKNETKMLNLFSLQSAKLSGSQDFQNYCQKALEAVEQAEGITSLQQLAEISLTHPYASEHNLVNCDPAGAINTDPPSPSPAATAVAPTPAATAAPASPEPQEASPQPAEFTSEAPAPSLFQNFYIPRAAPVAPAANPVVPLTRQPVAAPCTVIISGDRTLCANPENPSEADEDANEDNADGDELSGGN